MGNQATKEKDQRSIKTALDFWKESTVKLENFDCQLPEITKLPTLNSSTPSSIDIEPTEKETNKSKSEVEQEVQEVSMCYDCEVDYEHVDIAREDFEQVIKEVNDGKSGLGMSTKLIALISMAGGLGLILIGSVVY